MFTCCNKQIICRISSFDICSCEQQQNTLTSCKRTLHKTSEFYNKCWIWISCCRSNNLSSICILSIIITYTTNTFSDPKYTSVDQQSHQLLQAIAFKLSNNNKYSVTVVPHHEKMQYIERHDHVLVICAEFRDHFCLRITEIIVISPHSSI